MGPVKSGIGNTCSMWVVVEWSDQQGGRIKLVNDEDSKWILLMELQK
ncbi:hypothetical protein EMIT07CA2_150060 [Brevibacillus sp. IT-7CA2]